MSLNVVVEYDDHSELSALKPLEIRIANKDYLPVAFKVQFGKYHKLLKCQSKGIVFPHKTKPLTIRMRVSEETGPMSAPILKGTKRPKAEESLDLIRVELRVIAASVSDGATSDEEFQKYWDLGFHHSVNTVPVNVVFLSAATYYDEIAKVQEGQLQEAEKERAEVRSKIAQLQQQRDSLRARNSIYQLDVEKLRKRVVRLITSQDRLTVPTLVGLAVLCAAMRNAYIMASESF